MPINLKWDLVSRFSQSPSVLVIVYDRTGLLLGVVEEKDFVDKRESMAGTSGRVQRSHDPYHERWEPLEKGRAPGLECSE